MQTATDERIATGFCALVSGGIAMTLLGLLLWVMLRKAPALEPPQPR